MLAQAFRFFCMIAPDFEVDEVTGLYKWPVLLNGDWSRWTNEPCILLWGQASGCSRWNGDPVAFAKVGALLHAPEWLNLTAFRVSGCGFLVLAPGYSRAQALLLVENINRELRQVPVLSEPSYGPREAALTWGIVEIAQHRWNLPGALNAVVSPVEQAIREGRFGSINETRSDGQNVPRDDFFICSGRDGLTDLKLWGRTLALCSRYGDEPIALLMGDIDHFRNINDVYGHQKGDLSLQMVSHVLRRFESDKVAVFRLGGDEFIVWTRGYSLEHARRLAEDINAQVRALEVPSLRELEEPKMTGKVSLTWSVVATSPRGLELPSLLRQVDELLYETKAEERGTIGTKQM